MILAREEGLEIFEEAYSIDQWRDDAASGKLRKHLPAGQQLW